MDRRYQVFISSTYGDLKDERAEIIQALLELDCIPAGMELFPAATMEAWELIKGVIDDSDYYCLVVAGRYGSLGPTGLSFTEMEYDYALSQNKPIMAFLHADPEQLAAIKVEKTDAGKTALAAFRKKVEQNHHRRAWTSAPELGGLVSRGLVNMRKTNPAEGWVRGRFAATNEMLVELAELRAKVAELTITASAAAIAEPIKDNLAGGADIHKVYVSYTEKSQKERKNVTISVSWDTILTYVGPSLVSECEDTEFVDKLKLCAYHTVERQLKIKVEFTSVIIPTVYVDQIKVQLQALGQMAPGTRKRAVADKKVYWRLTEAGHRQLIAVQAIVKPATAIAAPLKAVIAANAGSESVSELPSA